MNWKLLPIPENDEQVYRDVVRLNSLGSLFFFTHFVLHKHRLAKLHWQMCATLETEDLHLVFEIPMSHFKALDVRTPIPTPEGFSLMGHIHVGDTVLGANGLPCKVIGVSPLYYSAECYEVEFNTGDKIVCDAGHLWETQSLEDYNNSKPKTYRSVVRTTKEIASKIDYGQQRNHRVRLSKAVQLNEQDLPIHPYVLGCWLGDGTTSTGSMTIGTEDEFIAEEIRRCGEPITKTDTSLRWQFYDGTSNFRDWRYRKTSFIQRLRNIGVVKDKHIPAVYMRGSAIQRLALLQGLMDTDGSVSKTGQPTFSNTNRRLSEQFRELACSLGLKPGKVGTYKERLNQEYVGYFHVVSVYSYSDYPIFRLPRKNARLNERTPQGMQNFRHIVSVKQVKPRYVKCIMVDSPDSLYLAGEAFIPTHNTTIGMEALSMWWALPFTARDEDMMGQLGYDAAWLGKMKTLHDQNARTLITHETSARVISMGKALDDHYLHNDVFRLVFADVIPTEETLWNNHSKMHRRDRSKPSDLTTATYEFRSVGQALQGIHVSGIINDDSVGKAAQDNMLNGDGSIMDDVYRWWKQTTTRFDPAAFTRSGIGRQLIIGNRWGHADLNSKIRANHPEFKIETHSAEGGCCALHPPGQPIFPEEWSMERLAHERQTLAHAGKSYDYVHFYLNKTLLEEDCIFKPEWLRKFTFKESRPDLDKEDLRNFLLIEHNAYEGETLGELNAGVLHKRMIVTLTDAKKRRRRTHAILVVGYDSERDKIYLLAVWAEKVPYGELMDTIYKIANRWGLHEFYLAPDAAQNMKFYLDERNRRDKTKALNVFALASDDADSAVSNRIEGLQTLFKNSQLWYHPSQKEFIAEYEAYPAGAIDVLDTLAQVPATLENVRRREMAEWAIAQQNAFRNRNAGAGGY